ncbi:hypothetical protein BpHYR1_023418 [Brachionus plicatilis]|uniref:Uncharacterized protein n=1 Tax=Brachionus plicatilis TaxID=10195 RepID=A0A3M7QYY5_BRAPC|nr:hypothetical protein BpHYR1_023418 [Brachionus plicatilis]
MGKLSRCSTMLKVVFLPNEPFEPVSKLFFQSASCWDPLPDSFLTANGSSDRIISSKSESWFCLAMASCWAIFNSRLSLDRAPCIMAAC